MQGLVKATISSSEKKDKLIESLQNKIQLLKIKQRSKATSKISKIDHQVRMIDSLHFKSTRFQNVDIIPSKTLIQTKNPDQLLQNDSMKTNIENKVKDCSKIEVSVSLPKLTEKEIYFWSVQI